MSVLIKIMEMPNKCWDCELFDALDIHFTDTNVEDDEVGWCRGCKREVKDVDYRNDKPIWCPLIEFYTSDGEWIENKDGSFSCSVCKFKFYPLSFKHCPNCGTKMKER